MLRKIFSTLLLLGVLMTSSVALADNIFDGDRNYILFYGQHGIFYYAIRDSLNVERYDPPNYIISIDYFMARSDGNEMINRMTCRYAYDWDTKTASVIFDDGRRMKLDYRLGGNPNLLYSNLAEVAFFLAYNQKFWGFLSEEFYDRCR